MKIMKPTVDLFWSFRSPYSYIDYETELSQLTNHVPKPLTAWNTLWLFVTRQKKASKKRQNHYEPITLTSDEDTIRIKYFDVNSNAQHEQALQLIIDHCGDSYIETTRMNETGYTTVEAECTHDTYSQ
jgi:hypothetical protein